MTDNEMSYLVAAVLGGGSISTLITGPLSDLVGRRRMILLSSVIFIVSVGIIVLAQDYTVLILGRIVQGVAVGIITIAVPLYLTESMPAHLRGRGVTAFQLLLTIGILLASLVGLLFTSSHDWRAMFLTAGIPGIIMFIGCFFLSDSPRWLGMKGRYDKALKVLLKTRSRPDAEKELEEIKRCLESERDPKAPKHSIFQKRYIIPLCIVFSIGMLNQLTGINSFLQFSAIILQKSGLHSDIVAMLGSNAITGLNFIMTVVAISLVDKIERRTMISFGTAGICLALLYCGFIYWALPYGELRGYLFLSGILAFIFCYAVGPGALVWAIMSELLPSKVRSSGLAIGLFLNSMASTVLAAQFLSLSGHIGYQGVFWLCAGFTFIYFILAMRFIPKTKGLSLEQIEKKFI